MKFFLLIIILSISQLALASNYYFSNVYGSDSYTSKQAQNMITPWQSLNKLNSIFFSIKPGDSVLFKRGETFYGALKVMQSGSSLKPVVIGAYGIGDKPILSGFKKINSWTSIGVNLWESSETLVTNSPVKSVTIDGKVAQIGRYPNSGWLNVGSSTNSSITDLSLNTNNWTGAEVVMRAERWIINKSKITSQYGSTINFTGGGFKPQEKWGYFIQNDKRTLDKQDEWYYNPLTKKLIVYSEYSPLAVSASTIDTIVSIRYNDYITFDNLTFIGANSFGIFIQVGNGLTIENCDLNYCADKAIYGTWGGSSSDYLSIKDNSFNNNINNGIQLISKQFSNTYIGFNSFRNVGIIDGMGGNDNFQNTAIYLEGDNSIVEYNKIDSVGYTGIIFNGNNTVIKNNLITNFCLSKDDGGGIYTGIGYGNPVSFGQKVINNIIINGRGNGYGTPDTSSSLANGIYMDDYTANVEIAGNTTANCSNNGIFLHNASSINVHENLSYNNISGQLAIQADSNTINNNLFFKNNLFSKTSNQPVSTLCGSINDIKHFGAFDSNYYARPINDISTIQINNWAQIKQLTLAEWKSNYGKDINSNKSPVNINNLTELRFEYNGTPYIKTVMLDTTYINVVGKVYNKNITLLPFTSEVLIKKNFIITTLPDAPTLSADDNLNMLAASHPLGDSVIAVCVNGGPYIPYSGPINVGNVDRAFGYWRFKVKSGLQRSESAVVSSPAFTALSVTLPITLITVKAYEKNKGVQLEGLIKMETNIQQYSIEKSFNGTDFSTIGTVKVNGSGTNTSMYSWFDANVADGVIYYRIVVLNKNGSTETSEIVKVVPKYKNSSLYIFPNPVSGTALSLQLNSEKGTYTIIITTISGQQVMSKVIQHAGGSAIQTIKMDHLASGVYQARVFNGKSVFSKTFIKN